MTVRLVYRANREDQSPLLKQRTIREKTIPRIINAGCLRCGPVELDDLEIAPSLESFVVLVTKIISPDKEAGHLVEISSITRSRASV